MVGGRMTDENSEKLKEINHRIPASLKIKFDNTVEKLSPYNKRVTIARLIEKYIENPDIIFDDPDRPLLPLRSDLIPDYHRFDYGDILATAPSVILRLNDPTDFWHAHQNGKLVIARMLNPAMETTLFLASFPETSQPMRARSNAVFQEIKHNLGVFQTTHGSTGNFTVRRLGEDALPEFAVVTSDWCAVAFLPAETFARVYDTSLEADKGVIAGLLERFAYLLPRSLRVAEL